MTVSSAAQSSECPSCWPGQLDHAFEWSATTAAQTPRAAVVFGTGPAWAAAQEAALHLREIANVPAEGMETREGATTGMYALDDDHLVLALPCGSDDRLADEAARVCATRGAKVLSAPWIAGTHRRLAAAIQLLHPLALAIDLAFAQGLNPDDPPWYGAYEETARRPIKSEEQR